jgi:hypothetical protein
VSEKGAPRGHTWNKQFPDDSGRVRWAGWASHHCAGKIGDARIPVGLRGKRGASTADSRLPTQLREAWGSKLGAWPTEM